MTQDNRIPLPDWLEAMLHYRSAPHQIEAMTMLYQAIVDADPCSMDQGAAWYLTLTSHGKLVKSFMNCEGE